VTVSVCGISEEGSSNELICEYDLKDDALPEKKIRVIPVTKIPKKIFCLEKNIGFPHMIIKNKGGGAR
jgi:hypothetical protein